MSLLYRLGLGFYLGYLGDWGQSPLVALVFPMGMLLYCVLVLPYRDCFGNYFCVAVHLGEFVVLYVGNYYQNVEYYTGLAQLGHDFMPFFVQLGAMLLCAGLGALFVLAKIYDGLQAWGNYEVYK